MAVTKGKFWKKTAAGLLALLIVAGAAPVSPISQVFERTSLTADAADNYSVWVGGIRITSDNAGNVFGDGKVSYDNATRTLTLNGYTYTGAGASYAAIMSDGDLTINAIGTNTVTHTPPADAVYSYGVYATGNLTVTGSGTLTAVSGSASYSNGVSSDDSITVEGNLNASSSGGAYSYGVEAFEGSLTVNAGGTLTAAGGNASSVSSGVYIRKGSLTVSGTLNAAADSGAIGSEGVEVLKGSITVNEGGTLTAAGGEAVASYGADAGGGINVNGILTAAGNYAAFYGKVINAAAGKGWADKAGTQGEKVIPANATGAELTYKKVTFPVIIDMTNAEISMVSNIPYSGSAVTPTVNSIKLNGQTLSLTEGTDYDIEAVTTDMTSAGDKTVNINFKGDYTGTVQKKFTVAPLNLATAGENFEFTVADAGAYDGTAKTPALTVKRNGSPLTENTDYEITGYDNNVNAGTTAKIYFKGKGNFSGNMSKMFTIAQAKATVTSPTSNEPIYYGTPVQLISAGMVTDGCTMLYAVNQDKDNEPTIGWTDNAAAITANSSGTYYVWYKIDGGTNYTDIAAKPVAVQVDQGFEFLSQSYSVVIDSYVFDGTAHKPTIKGKTYGTVSYTYYDTDTGKELSEAPTAVGNYRVEVYASGDSKYESQMDLAEYSILDPFSGDGMADVAVFKKNNIIPEAEGRVFAGWFTDSACTKAYTGDSGKAYAKFIDAKILTVKAQISSGTTENSDSTSIRFITALDSLRYKNIGFRITFNGRTLDQKLTKVYSAINANGSKVKPGVFSKEANYMGAFSLNNIPKSVFGNEFKVTPYYTTEDGTVVEGETKSFTIANMIK